MYREQHLANVWIEAVKVEGEEGRRRHTVTLKQHGMEGRARALGLSPGLNSLSAILALQPQFLHQQHEDNTLSLLSIKWDPVKVRRTVFAILWAINIILC